MAGSLLYGLQGTLSPRPVAALRTFLSFASTLGCRMLLYQRFDIPDNYDWSAEQPVTARDCFLQRDVHVYRVEAVGGDKDEENAGGNSRLAKLVGSDIWSPTASEVFTASGSIWVVVPFGAAEPPILQQCRQAGLLPGSAVAEAATVPRPPDVIKAVEVKPSSVPVQPAARMPAKRQKLSAIFRALFVLPLLSLLALWAALYIYHRLTAAPPPIVQFTGARTAVVRGNSTTLSWNVTGASDVEIDNGVGPVESTGSTNVAPASTTTYTLTATGKDKSTTRQVTIYVFAGLRKPKVDQHPSHTIEPPPHENPPFVSSNPQPPPPVAFSNPPPQQVQLPPDNLTAPSPQHGPPMTGELHCTEPVQPGGHVVFENLPDGFLHFDVQNRPNWKLLIKRQSDGRQTLVMISQAAQVQNSCTVHWTVMP